MTREENGTTQAMSEQYRKPFSTMTPMERHWASLTPKQRQTRVAAMAAGRRRAKRKRLRESLDFVVTQTGEGDSVEQTLELLPDAIAFLTRSGSRQRAEHLLDVAALVLAKETS